MATDHALNMYFEALGKSRASFCKEYNVAPSTLQNLIRGNKKVDGFSLGLVTELAEFGDMYQDDFVILMKDYEAGEHSVLDTKKGALLRDYRFGELREIIKVELFRKSSECESENNRYIKFADWMDTNIDDFANEPQKTVALYFQRLHRDFGDFKYFSILEELIAAINYKHTGERALKPFYLRGMSAGLTINNYNNGKYEEPAQIDDNEIVTMDKIIKINKALGLYKEVNHD